MTDNPRKFDYVEKVKLRACDLRPGMFVCELDRSWLETPFLLQGFEVRDDADIEEVMKYCEHVYIDLQRTKLVQVTIEAIPEGSFLQARKNPFRETYIEASESTRHKTSSLIKSFIEEIRFGRSLDVQLAKAAVSECVARVVQNPEAMMFLTRMRSKDESTSEHAFNVCIYSIVLGRILGLDHVQLENLGTCGLLHDMGKVAIPASVLNKKDPLNDGDVALIQTHAKEGRDILMSGRNLFSGAVDVAYCHHENIDGSGYPRGLQGFQLNLNSKIVSIVDKYAAITSARPYRPARDHLSAVSILNQLSRENKVDSEMAARFITYLGIYPPGSIVELSTGEVAIVIESNPKQRLRPQILVVRDADKDYTQVFVDMSEKPADEKGRAYRIVTVRRPDDYGIDLAQYFDLIVQAFG